MTITCVEFKPLRKGALHGFAIFEIQPTGIRLRDCTVMESNGKRWIGMPGKPQITPEKTVRIVDGKPQYVSVVEWTSRERSDAFKDAALAALLDAFPTAYDEQVVA